MIAIATCQGQHRDKLRGEVRRRLYYTCNSASTPEAVLLKFARWIINDFLAGKGLEHELDYLDCDVVGGEGQSEHHAENKF